MEQAEKKVQQEKEKAEKKEAIRIQKEKEKAEKKEAIRIQKEKEENIKKERKHFIFSPGQSGEVHFKNSSAQNLWGIDSKKGKGKYFYENANAKPNDILWFVFLNKIIAVATFVGFNKRENGPLVSLTATNEELGWTEKDGDWDTEVMYKDLYNISDCELYPEIKGQSSIRKYNEETCAINLPAEYLNIVRYSKITRTM